MKNSVLWFISIWLTLLTGCSLFGWGVETPRVSVSRIEVQKIEFFESSFEVVLRIYNTNDSPLKVKGLDCDLELNDRHFATGVTKVDTMIPAYGTATIPVEVYSSVVDLFRGIFAMKKKQAFTYKLKGNVRIDSDIFTPSKIPFKSEGEITIEGLKDSGAS
jgi:LEA14-like dessication related protein